MAIDLGEIAAGLPFAASIAMATGISAFREGRRRTSLNEAVHELRRPLQSLALSLPAASSEDDASRSALRMATSALDRLDREVNGEPSGSVAERVRIRPLVEAALARWKPLALESRRSLRMSWEAAEPVLWAEAKELAQALDNLISNGFEHGAGAVEVVVAEGRGGLRISVRDGGPSRRRADSAPYTSASGPSAAGPRHGHGLRIVRRVAARHGGGFRLRRLAGGTEARLVLPLAGGRR